MPVNILFVDDDTKLQKLLKEYFRTKGFEMVTATSGNQGLDCLRRSTIDIVILDLMLPEMDGFETLSAIKQISDVPVIMLTALEDETDRIVGLEMGADDYLHKPINPRELLARIKAVLRRAGQTKGTHPLGQSLDQQRLESMGVAVDVTRRQVYLKDEIIDLSTVEFDILCVLIQSEGRVVSRERLMDMARGRAFEAFDRSIDVHISRIRKKIEDDPARPARIKTVWGKGYMWTGDGGE